MCARRDTGSTITIEEGQRAQANRKSSEAIRDRVSLPPPFAREGLGGFFCLYVVDSYRCRRIRRAKGDDIRGAPEHLTQGANGI